MKLYLVRHAIAEDLADHEEDSLRPLTDKGRRKMKKIATALKDILVQPDLIVSSPYVRASQTASVLAKGLGYKEEIIYSDFLMPMAEPGDMIREINEKYSVDELILVGHEPIISSLASNLLADNSDLAINFKKGGVCCLSVDNRFNDRRAILEWLITPKISTRIS